MTKDVDLGRLIDLSPAVHYVAEATGSYAAVYVSPGVQGQLGYRPGQFTDDAEFWVSHVHPEDRAGLLADMAELFERGRLVLEYRFLHADGSWRWMHDELVLVRGEHGDPDRIIGSWLDVTERKTAEERHRRTAMRLREAQQIAGIGTWEFDAATGEQWWSEETYRIIGEDPETCAPSAEGLLGKIHPDDRPRFDATVEQALTDGEPYAITYRIVARDGREKTIDGRGRGVADSAIGAPPDYFVGTVHDVTERVAMQREVVAAQESERRRIGEDLHDSLGQELTGISFGLEALAQRLAAEECPHARAALDLREMVQKSIATTRRIARFLAPGLSQQSGLSAALEELAREVTEYSHIVCRAHTPERAHRHGIDVETNLYRIAQEAIANAQKHGAPKNIELRYGCDDGTIALEIVDDGIGIAPDAVEGMGFRSMRHRAGLIHGRLEIANGPGGGARIFCSCSCA